MHDSDDLKRLAHDVRNALNGVAVNLEVARTRAARGVEPLQLTSFLETAAVQLEEAVRLHKLFTDAAVDPMRGAKPAARSAHGA